MRPLKILLLWLAFAVASCSLSFAEENVDKILRVLYEQHGWDADRVTIKKLGGGLTNDNYKIAFDEFVLFVRCSSDQNALLNVSLEREWQCTRLTASAGIAPQPILFLQEELILISEFIETGGNIVNLRKTETMRNFCQLVRALHKLNVEFPTSFCPFETINQYIENAKIANVELPQIIFDVVMPSVEKIKTMTRVNKPVPCHLDLHHGNVLDNAERMWLIDWEYAAMGDPIFDLATAASVENYTDGEMREMLKAYLDKTELSEEEFQHFFNMRILADLRWALWCYIQNQISTLTDNYIEQGDDFLRQSLIRIQRGTH